jgi:hypothetical protein
MGTIPKDVRSRVAEEVIRQAINLGWEDLSPSERSKNYEKWVNDPQIGGQLLNYLPSSGVRVWIKDGPMKEYSRARRGLGPYSQFVGTVERTEFEIARRVLGDQWSVMDEKFGVKPASFRACREDEIVRVYWGTIAQLKHLFWAAITADANERNLVVVLGTRLSPVSSTDKVQIARIARRVHADLKFCDI